MDRMFKFISASEQMLETRKKSEALAAKQKSIDSASSIAFVALAEKGSIDEVTAAEHTELFATWETQVSYGAGDIRRYKDVLYRCLQAHTSQGDWTPDKTPALWVKMGDPAVEFPLWSQPVGAHDAYGKGDKVSYKEKRWISTVDGNVWEPGVYGWEEAK